MNAHATLRSAVSSLTCNNVFSPRLDTEILLSRAWRKDRAWILAHPEAKAPATVAATFRRMISRRARREPLAYILGYKEFYGLRFTVNRHVLVPRPETELLVETAVNQIATAPFTSPPYQGGDRGGLRTTPYSLLPTIIDVGTGSGCIAVTLAKLFPQARVFATDISRQALAVARENARRHEVRVKFLSGDLLEPIIRNFANLQICKLVIVANLPYIRTRDLKGLAPEIRDHEPRGALDGGRDGLREYRRLLRQISRFQAAEAPTLRQHRAGVGARAAIKVFCEMDPSQARHFRAMAKKILPAARLSLVPSPAKARCAILSVEAERRR